MEVAHTPQSDLEPRVKKLISRLYQAESKAVQQRNKLVDQIEELDKRIEAISARRDEVANEFKKVGTETSEEVSQAFHALLGTAEEEQKDWTTRTEEAIAKAGQSLAVWADQAAEASRGTLESLRLRFNRTRENWEEMRDAYSREADQTVKQLDEKVSTLEAKAKEATGDAKEAFEQQIDKLKGSRQDLQTEVANLQSATAETWKNFKTNLESRVDAAREAIRSSKDDK